MTVNHIEPDFSMFNPEHVQKYHDAEVKPGVMENNAKGLGFWHRLGFSVSRRSGNIIVPEKALR